MQICMLLRSLDCGQHMHVQGVGFWTVYEPNQDAPASQGGGRGVYGIYPTDATFGLIKQEAQSLNTRAAPVAGCDAAAHTAPAVTSQDCTSTQVKGLVGTGSALHQLQCHHLHALHLHLASRC